MITGEGGVPRGAGVLDSASSSRTPSCGVIFAFLNQIQDFSTVLLMMPNLKPFLILDRNSGIFIVVAKPDIPAGMQLYSLMRIESTPPEGDYPW